jgi:hypothetical protein
LLHKEPGLIGMVVVHGVSSLQIGPSSPLLQQAEHAESLAAGFLCPSPSHITTDGGSVCLGIKHAVGPIAIFYICRV